MRGRPPAGILAAAAAAALAVLGVLHLSERQAPGEAPGPHPARLSPGREHERVLGAGERHDYLVLLTPGQLLSVVVDQRGVDLALALVGPAGERLLEVDGPNGEKGRERLAWIATVAGGHRLELRPLDETARGRYAVRVEEPRPATARDRHRAAAARLLFEAQELRRSPDADGSARALALYRRARRESAAAGDRHGEALALVRLGQTLPQLARPEEAVEAFRLGAALYDRLGETREAALALNRLGRLCRTTGRLSEGRDAYAAARERFRALGERRDEASMLHNLALLEDAAGLRWPAQVAYRQALEVWRSLGARDEEATTLTNLGETYLALGQLQLARDAFEAALELRREPTERAATLNGLAVAYRRLDRSEQALAWLEEALELQLQAGDRHGEAITRNNLGLTYFRQRRFDAAEREYELALERFREAGDEHSTAFAHLNLAWLWDETGNPARAVAGYRRALPVFARLGDPDGEASALYGIARAEAHRGRLGPASASAQEALDRVESVRTGARSPASRTSYLAAKNHYYELAVELSMRLHESEPGAGHDLRAFLTSERSRARGLLDSLAEGPAPAPAPPPDPSLEASLRRVEERLAAAQHARLTTADAATGAALDRELRHLAAELDRLRTLRRLRSGSPVPAGPGEVLRLGEIQAELDPGTVLLEYFLGEERSFLWLVSRGSLLTRSLPGRARIEPLARRYHELLAAGPARGLQAQAELVAAALGDLVLGPLRGKLAASRLVLVAHGALEYVPFAALPLPGDAAARPLIAEYELVSLPSASILVVLRRDLPSRSPPPGLVAVVADPVYERDDPRVERRAAVLVAAAERGQEPPGPLAGRFPRLPGTRREAEGILAFAAPSERFAALGFAASRETVFGDELAGYRIVHFATHGLLDTEHPELSGLVLSQVDRAGRPVPGILWSHEIHGLRLPAELVVLSACRTALGREVRGEGLAGLTRGFLDAGAARVIVTLWSVGDEATGRLMERFYRGLLVQGLPAAAALRQAQLELSAEARWRHPSHWAGFTVQGEWR